MVQETSSLQSAVSLRSFSRMDPIEEFNLEAGMGQTQLSASKRMVLLSSPGSQTCAISIVL